MTPADSGLPLQAGCFATLPEALDYAAGGRSGLNFYSGRGQLAAALGYRELRSQAQVLARKLVGLGFARGSRVALVAETDPDFVRFFFACQYAGLVPVPLPAAVHLGGRQGMVEKLRGILVNCGARAAMATTSFLPLLAEAATGLDLQLTGTAEVFDGLAEVGEPPSPPRRDDTAYIQYTSGSTRFPRGVVVTQAALMANLEGICRHGLQVRSGDRCVSWLPFYHDMGLVGFLLAPLAAQLSVDYLSTRDFAMRPRLWPALISANRATISYSPTFGFALCSRRIREDELDQYDLSSWRIAGTGAEPIRPDVLEEFSRIFARSGFRKNAFVASYGMAEATLAVSFADLGQGFEADRVDGERLAAEGRALPPEAASSGGTERSFVLCGRPLPGHAIAIRDASGRDLPERACGILHVRGPSVMSGYLNDPQATGEVLDPEGWLDTGDLAYRIGDQIVITGRRKDLIIINGRNIWPQDLEYLAEQLPDVRPRDAAAFSIPAPDGGETAVLVVQHRRAAEQERRGLVDKLRGLVREEFGIDCLIELVPPHTLPQTSSGKLSRFTARKEFLERNPDLSGLPGALVQNFG